jgi:plastocyanin
MKANPTIVLLLLVAAVTALCAGCASEPTSGATPAPTAVTVAPATSLPGGSGNASVALSLTARNIAFDTGTLSAPAGSTVALTFVNDDAGVPHNFALYTDSSASVQIFTGALVTGPATTVYTFTAPGTPGTYFFRCDPHPATMTGSFIVT